MSEYSVVVDSVADLPRETVGTLGIVEVPFPVVFGNQTFRDKVDLKSKQFFQMLRSKLDYPKTSAPPVGEYLTVFQRLISEGRKVLTLTIPARNSGAYQSATLARSLLENGEVEIVDSGSISMGLGLIAMEAVEAVGQERTKERILERIQQVIARVQILAVIPDLTWAARGGRVSSAVARIASLLNGHPIIRLRQGVTEQVSKANPSQTIDKLIQRVKAAVGKQPAGIAVMHGDSSEQAYELKRRLLLEINCPKEILISEVGPALGSHSGPDVLAVAFYPLSPV